MTSGSRFGFLCTLLAFSICSASSSHAYSIGQRWTNTKTNGGGLQRGDSITVTWSVVPDGESWPRGGNSNLIDYLDDGWNVNNNNRTPDLTNRNWWNIMNRVYNQYSRVSGVNMVYEPEQDGNGNDTGKSGDIRIGGVPFTWENSTGGVLADNTLPNGGDMRIDTYRSGGPSWWHTNTTPFFNLISHESGHGMGLHHDSSSGRNFIMETPLNTNILGLQFDDVYAFNRMYGDPREKNGGNDTLANGTWLGNIGTAGSVDMGKHSENFAVNEFDGDWLGIDGNSDEDWFEFRITGRTSVDINVIPQGPTYTTNHQGNINFKERADLNWAVYDANGTQIMKVDRTLAGSNERMYDLFLEDGFYYVRVDGEADRNQFYKIEVSANDSLSGFDSYASPSIILHDKFDVGNSGNVNFQRELEGRQVHGYFDSSWTEQNNLGSGTVGTDSGKLMLQTVTDGDATNDVARAELMRNFGLQLQDKVWSVSFNLNLTGDTAYTAENLFTFAVDDNDLSQGSAGQDPRISLQIGFDGTAATIRRDGTIMGTGNLDPADIDVEFIFDETQTQKTVDVLLNGQLFIDTASVWFDDLERYFGFEQLVGSGNSSGLTTSTLIDDLMIEVLDPQLAGDFDGNFLVDSRDFLLWQRGESRRPYSNYDLAAWEATLGNSGSPPDDGGDPGDGGGQLITPVPEPASSVLFIFGTIFCSLSARRKR